MYSLIHFYRLEVLGFTVFLSELLSAEQTSPPKGTFRRIVTMIRLPSHAQTATAPKVIQWCSGYKSAERWIRLRKGSIEASLFWWYVRVLHSRWATIISLLYLSKTTTNKQQQEEQTKQNKQTNNNNSNNSNNNNNNNNNSNEEKTNVTGSAKFSNWPNKDHAMET